MLRFFTHGLWKAVFLLSLLTVGCGHADSVCRKRRCLAEMLIKKGYTAQPQYENCTQIIHVPFIQYQTLSVDTKNLRLSSRVQASLVWTDPELKWDTSVYEYDIVILPVDKVWIPELQITNGIATTDHSSSDLLAYSNGTLKHTVILNAEVICEFNLFNYPFASDECPVAIQIWSADGCGPELVFGELMLVDGADGDWITNSASLQKQRNDRNYIMVGLSMKFLNPFLTLLLPSILIMVADVVSFSLPLGGSERNSFKVTLVLSFTMFLSILNDELPDESQCSPIIRTHFCICLILLVLSMLVSMVLTRVAKDGSLVFCCKGPVPENREVKEDMEANADVSVIQLSDSEKDSRMLRKLANFLKHRDTKTPDSKRHQTFANTMDKMFVWFYVFFGSIYFFAMAYVMVNYKCTMNHFDFWC